MSIFGFLDNLASSAKGEAVDLIAEGSLAGSRKAGARRSSSLWQDYMGGMERGRRGVPLKPARHPGTVQPLRMPLPDIPAVPLRNVAASPAAIPQPYKVVGPPPPHIGMPTAAPRTPRPTAAPSYYQPPAPVSVPPPNFPPNHPLGHLAPSAQARLRELPGDSAVTRSLPRYGPPSPDARNYVLAPGSYDSAASRYIGGSKLGRAGTPQSRQASLVHFMDNQHRYPAPYRKDLPGYRTGDLDRAFGDVSMEAQIDDIIRGSSRDTTPIPGAGPARVSGRRETIPVRPARKKKIYGGPQAQANAEARNAQILAENGGRRVAKYGKGGYSTPDPQGAAQARARRKLVNRPVKKPVLSATGGAPTSGRSSGAVPGAPPPPKKRWPGPQGRRKVPLYARRHAASSARLPGVPAGSHGSWGAAARPVPQPLPSGPAAMGGVAKGKRPGSHTAGYTRYKQGQAAAHQVMTSSVQRGPGGKRLLPTKRGMKGTLHPQPQSWSRRNRAALGALGAGAIGVNVLAGNAYQGRSRRHPTSRAPQMPGGMPY